MCTICGTYGGQKTALVLDTLELELGMAVNYHVGAGTKPRSFENIVCSQAMSHLSSLSLPLNYVLFKKQSQYVVQASLKDTILLSQLMTVQVSNVSDYSHQT